jgi:hypothetical protein
VHNRVTFSDVSLYRTRVFYSEPSLGMSLGRRYVELSLCSNCVSVLAPLLGGTSVDLLLFSFCAQKV